MDDLNPIEKSQNLDQISVVDQNQKSPEKYNFLQEKEKRRKHLTGVLKHLRDKYNGRLSMQLDLNNQQLDKNENDLLKKKKELLKSEYELQVEQKTMALDEMIQNLDENNQDLRIEISDTFEDVSRLKEERGDHIPGKKIKKFMANWQRQIGRAPTNDDIKEWASEYWITLEMFEKHLVEEEMKFRAEQAQIIWKLTNDQIFQKNRVYFRIQALEQALESLKIQKSSEIERLNMIIADLESKQMRQQILSKKNESDLLSKIGTARLPSEQLSMFQSILDGKNYEIQQLKVQVAEFENQRQQEEGKDPLVQVQLINERRFRKFYQKNFLQFIRDLKFFQNDPEKFQKFESMNEDDDEIENQAKIHFDLKNMDLQTELIDHVNSNHDLRVKVEIYEKELQIMRDEGEKLKEQNKQQSTDLFKAKRERFKQMIQQIELRKQGKESSALQQSIMQNMVEDEILSLFQNQIKRQVKMSNSINRNEAKGTVDKIIQDVLILAKHTNIQDMGVEKLEQQLNSRQVQSSRNVIQGVHLNDIDYDYDDPSAQKQAKYDEAIQKINKTQRMQSIKINSKQNNMTLEGKKRNNTFRVPNEQPQINPQQKQSSEKINVGLTDSSNQNKIPKGIEELKLGIVPEENINACKRSLTCIDDDNPVSVSSQSLRDSIDHQIIPLSQKKQSPPHKEKNQKKLTQLELSLKIVDLQILQEQQKESVPVKKTEAQTKLRGSSKSLLKGKLSRLETVQEEKEHEAKNVDKSTGKSASSKKSLKNVLNHTSKQKNKQSQKNLDKLSTVQQPVADSEKDVSHEINEDKNANQEEQKLNKNNGSVVFQSFDSQMLLQEVTIDTVYKNLDILQEKAKQNQVQETERVKEQLQKIKLNDEFKNEITDILIKFNFDKDNSDVLISTLKEKSSLLDYFDQLNDIIVQKFKLAQSSELLLKQNNIKINPEINGNAIDHQDTSNQLQNQQKSEVIEPPKNHPVTSLKPHYSSTGQFLGVGLTLNVLSDTITDNENAENFVRKTLTACLHINSILNGHEFPLNNTKDIQKMDVNKFKPAYSCENKIQQVQAENTDKSRTNIKLVQSGNNQVKPMHQTKIASQAGDSPNPNQEVYDSAPLMPSACNIILNPSPIQSSGDAEIKVEQIKIANLDQQNEMTQLMNSSRESSAMEDFQDKQDIPEFQHEQKAIYTQASQYFTQTLAPKIQIHNPILNSKSSQNPNSKVPVANPTPPTSTRSTQTSETLISPQTFLNSALFRMDKQLESELQKTIGVFDDILREFVRVQKHILVEKSHRQQEQNRDRKGQQAESLFLEMRQQNKQSAGAVSKRLTKWSTEDANSQKDSDAGSSAQLNLSQLQKQGPESFFQEFNNYDSPVVNNKYYDPNQKNVSQSVVIGFGTSKRVLDSQIGQNHLAIQMHDNIESPIRKNLIKDPSIVNLEQSDIVIEASSEITSNRDQSSHAKRHLIKVQKNVDNEHCNETSPRSRNQFSIVNKAKSINETHQSHKMTLKEHQKAIMKGMSDQIQSNMTSAKTLTNEYKTPIGIQKHQLVDTTPQGISVSGTTSYPQLHIQSQIQNHLDKMMQKTKSLTSKMQQKMFAVIGQQMYINNSMTNLKTCPSSPKKSLGIQVTTKYPKGSLIKTYSKQIDLTGMPESPHDNTVEYSVPLVRNKQHHLFPNIKVSIEPDLGMYSLLESKSKKKLHDLEPIKLTNAQKFQQNIYFSPQGQIKSMNRGFQSPITEQSRLIQLKSEFISQNSRTLNHSPSKTKDRCFSEIKSKQKIMDKYSDTQNQNKFLKSNRNDRLRQTLKIHEQKLHNLDLPNSSLYTNQFKAFKGFPNTQKHNQFLQTNTQIPMTGSVTSELQQLLSTSKHTTSPSTSSITAKSAQFHTLNKMFLTKRTAERYNPKERDQCIQVQFPDQDQFQYDQGQQ